MYYICKTFANWSLFDKINSTDRLLDPDEIDRLKRHFAGLLEDNKILLAIQIAGMPLNRLNRDTPIPHYLIQRFYGNMWLFYDGVRHTGRQLEPADVAWIKKLVPGLVSEPTGQIAFLITALPGNKLLQLTAGESSAPGKKTGV